MKRKRNGRLILMVGVGLAAPLFLLGVPIRAQQSSRSMDAPPGMEEGGGPFSAVTHGTTTFGGRQADPDKPAVSTFPGEVHGVTRYPSGLPMPNAEVAILNGDANVDRTTVSGSDGSFVFKNLKPGEYQLTARKDGFAPSPIAKVSLDAGKIATADVPLGPSLAASPINTNPAALLKASHAPTYRMRCAQRKPRRAPLPSRPQPRAPRNSRTSPFFSTKFALCRSVSRNSRRNARKPERRINRQPPPGQMHPQR
jgi:hypothetical protein